MNVKILSLHRLFSVANCSIILFVMLISCASNDRSFPLESMQGAELISLNTENVDISHVRNASKLVAELNYYPLERAGDHHVGNIDKVIQWHDYYYICDRPQNAVFVYTAEGKFVSVLAKLGAGPDEYIQTDEVTVDRANGDIHIYSYANRKVLIYNQNAEYIRSKPLNYYGSAFYTVHDSLTLVYNARAPNEQLFKDTFPHQFRFYSIDQQGNLGHNQMPFEFREEMLQIPLPSPLFYTQQDTLSLFDPLNNTVFRVDPYNYTLRPRYQIDFQQAAGPNWGQLKGNEWESVVQTYKQEGKKNWASLNDWMEMDQVIVLRYGLGKYSNLALYSKASQKLINLGALWINDLDAISMPSVYGTTDRNTFFGFIEPIYLHKQSKPEKTSQRIKDLVAKSTETDNPILVEFSLKEF
jgi:hypothetical protein